LFFPPIIETFLASTSQPEINFWDVSRVVDMERAFAASSFNGALNLWDVSLVTDMALMVSLVIQMRLLPQAGSIDLETLWNDLALLLQFASSSFNSGSISNWKVGSVVDMESM
jgi:Mycoplasma protein of unknown function, DUF285